MFYWVNLVSPLKSTREDYGRYPDAVVQVRPPAGRLFHQRLPADENVMGRLALEDKFEAPLQAFGGGQPFLGA
jgi:hypothetical protein